MYETKYAFHYQNISWFGCTKEVIHDGHSLETTCVLNISDEEWELVFETSCIQLLKVDKNLNDVNVPLHMLLIMNHNINQ